MAYQDFLNMYAVYRKMTPERLVEAEGKSFPLTTNSRGEALVSFLQLAANIELKGKRVLDIGCAYGGLSIALAKAGANVTGLDVSQRFIQFARENAKDSAEIDFHIADASGVGIRGLFPKGTFDVVILNDVLEHIYDTAGLAANMGWLLNDTGFAYFKVPNAHHPRWAIEEGHRKIFGLTLLDPDCWFYLHPKRASIFYRRLSYFLSIFAYNGLPIRFFVDDEFVFHRYNAKMLSTRLQALSDKAATFDTPNQFLKSYLSDGLKRFQEEAFYDVYTKSYPYVQFKYGSAFFTGFAARPGSTLAPAHAARTIEEVGIVAESGNTLPVKPRAPAPAEAVAAS